MNKYRVIIAHDGGRVSLTVRANSSDEARHAATRAENCPRGAIKGTKLLSGRQERIRTAKQEFSIFTVVYKGRKVFCRTYAQALEVFNAAMHTAPAVHCYAGGGYILTQTVYRGRIALML